MVNVLLVDDEKNFINGVGEILESYNYKCFIAYNGLQALEILSKERIDTIVTDLIMPEMDGIEFLTQVNKSYPNIPSIVITAHGGDRENRTVRALGAKNFILKPIDVDQLANMIEGVSETIALTKERDILKEKLREHDEKNNLFSLVGKSPKINDLLETISIVAPTNLSILLTGESGVGKQVVAQTIHNRSNRNSMPFVDTHCASFSQNLLEDELFGHEKGAYTGAVSRKKGIFEKANGGTLFLDEIGEISLTTQVKLLKVIEEKKYTPLGSDKVYESDFRLICATNRDLEEEVRKGNFREDLYYRINKMTLFIPPLREREGDIILLCDNFIKKFSKNYSKDVKSLSSKALDALCSYQWPGNIRELENVIESAVVMAKSDVIGYDDLPPTIKRASSIFHTAEPATSESDTSSMYSVSDTSRLTNTSLSTITEGEKQVNQLENNINAVKIGDGQIILDIATLDKMETQIIKQLLAANNNNKTKVSKILQINRKTLLSKLNKYGN